MATQQNGSGNKKYYAIGGGLLLLLVLAVIYFRDRTGDSKTVCYDLPTTTNPEIFGPHYWAAFHDLGSRVPCPGCRGFAEKFLVFFHDTVNVKTGKPLYDKENFDQFTQMFCDIKEGKDVFNHNPKGQVAEP